MHTGGQTASPHTFVKPPLFGHDTSAVTVAKKSFEVLVDAGVSRRIVRTKNKDKRKNATHKRAQTFNHSLLVKEHK